MVLMNKLQFHLLKEK